jgi:hypothetical protein
MSSNLLQYVDAIKCKHDSVQYLPRSDTVSYNAMAMPPADAEVATASDMC